MLTMFQATWTDSLIRVKSLIREGVFTPVVGRQAVIVAVALVLAAALAWLLKRSFLPRIGREVGEESLWYALAAKGAGYLQPLLAAIALEVAALAYCAEFPHCHLIVVCAKLAWAWLLVRLFTSFVAPGVFSWTLISIIYFLIALDILGFFDPLTQFLDRFGIQLDNVRLSLLTVFKGVMIAAFLLLFARYLCKFLEENLPKSNRLSPRQQLLLLKSSKLVLYTAVIVIALDSVGLDFYLISIFSGAFGLGLGFGLQRVVANIFSGYVILLDKSIRPGDIIETEGLHGWIESLHGRFVSMITRDGKSHLIPNEHLITNKVINWSFSHPNVRLKIPIGIAYDSDLHRAMELMLAAARKHKRVLQHPNPVAQLLGFGDSAVNLELRFWINDPQDGITNICSDIQLDIWDAFREHGIAFPFPQRDVHLKTAPGLTVVVSDQAPEPGEPPSAAKGAEFEASPSPTQPGADPPPK